MQKSLLEIDVKAVLFDLDGTLVDSAPDISAALNRALAHCNLPVFDMETTRSWIGNGVDKLLERALIASNVDDIDRRTQGLKQRFFEVYAQTNGDHSRIYPGIQQTLNYCLKHNIRMACVTNKPSDFSRDLLEKLNIMDYFEVLISGDDVTHKKPNPMMLHEACDRLQINSEHCLMVGDSDNDVYAAKAVNMRICCVSYGYNQGVDLQDLGIDYWVDSVSELITLN